VISQSWCYQQTIADRIDENGARTGEGVDFEEVVAGLIRLKRMLSISSLVVIGEVPGAGINCFEEMTRSALSQRFYPEQVRSRRLPDGAADFNRRMARAAQQTGEFYFFDPADALCDANGCRNIDDLGRPIYSDAYHLSIFGSRLVIAHFAPQFKQMLEARKGEAAREPAGTGRFKIAPANMAAEQGHCFIAIVECGMPGDRESKSSVTVWENDVQIGPAH
jgi:hypothetical protein